MKLHFFPLTTTLLLLAAINTPAATRYVNLNNPAPAAPYTDWASAATNIQDAIDAAVAGDEIVVTNGVYQTGGRAITGTTNRVAVTKPLAVRSVNGPEVTVIRGYQVSGWGVGESAVRCVYLTNGTLLTGFTLTNGSTRLSGDYDRERTGGGAWCASASVVVSNCTLAGNLAGSGGAAYQGTFNNCVFTGNWVGLFGGNATGQGGGTYLAVLNNCVLSNNTAVFGGGAYRGVLNDCTIAGNWATLQGGGTYQAAQTNCMLTRNWVRNDSGGGAYGGILDHCTLESNWTDWEDGLDGGGAAQATLNNCVLTGNSASGANGGGAAGCVLSNCRLRSNRAVNGGGAFQSSLNNCVLVTNITWGYGGGASLCTLSNCTLAGNIASGFFLGTRGGGAYGGTLHNCTLTGNSADEGGGVALGTLNNCTLTGNSAYKSGGGAYSNTLNNCIVYYNTARLGGSNYSGGTFNYSCTTPLPPVGIGNTSTEPQLADALHLSAGSPCRGAGSAAYAIGLDIDGEDWESPPSIGCDEFHFGAITGPLSVAIVISHTNAATGFEVSMTALISGHASVSRWEFGDGTGETNWPFATHIWSGPGDYTVVAWAYNESHPDGVSATSTVHVVEHPVHYVAAGSRNPVAPFNSWATAATNIQNAIDVAVPGGVVLVSNGVYQTGVTVPRRLTVWSVNGPDVTIIDGGRRTRCATLRDGSTLTGFTLINGFVTPAGAGAWCESAGVVVSNCVITGNSAGVKGGGVYSGTLNNCVLTGNSTFENGGGAYLSTLNNCTLTANTSERNGGGADSCILNLCTLAANSAPTGGGANSCTLNFCTLTRNSAPIGIGGGAAGCTLNNCTLMDNSAMTGGGAVGGVLNNCALAGNSASPCNYSNLGGGDGGGTANATLNNCTLVGNSACSSGGGTYRGTLNNCITYYNTTASGIGSNHASSTLNFSCTTPLPTNGVGNIMDEPQLATLAHLSAGSPCRSAGSAAYSSGLDVDGEPWLAPPSIGCDEFSAGAVAGPLTVAIKASYTNVLPGFAVEFSALIGGRVTASRWEFGDGTVASNQPVSSHSWAGEGDYRVVLEAFSDAYPEGVSALVIVHVSKPVHHVASASANPVAPYSSWATAARTIQDAIDAATVPGVLVLVSNGVYQSGGRAIYRTQTNRVAVTKPLAVRSVNGPQVTIIRGHQVPGTTNGNAAIRCVYLTNGALLVGFTLTNGATQLVHDDWDGNGGGVWSESANAVIFELRDLRQRGSTGWRGGASRHTDQLHVDGQCGWLLGRWGLFLDLEQLHRRWQFSGTRRRSTFFNAEQLLAHRQ